MFWRARVRCGKTLQSTKFNLLLSWKGNAEEEWNGISHVGAAFGNKLTSIVITFNIFNMIVVPWKGSFVRNLPASVYLFFYLAHGRKIFGLRQGCQFSSNIIILLWLFPFQRPQQNNVVKNAFSWNEVVLVSSVEILAKKARDFLYLFLEFFHMK